MTQITASQVKELREQTGAGMMDAKKALVTAEGDMAKATEILREQGLLKANKKAERDATDGLVDSYIHAGGRIGVLLEINCETDFVARTDDFMALSHDIAMHIAASAPQFVSRDDIEAGTKQEKEADFVAEAKEAGKPADVAEKIAAGKMDKYLQESCLLEQPFIKDPDRTVQDILSEHIAKLGENIQVKRFARFSLGQ